MSAASSTKPLVVVVGGAGVTGLSVLKGLAKAGSWNLAATVRPGSVDKPEVSTLRELGVEIRISDFQTDAPAELDKALEGADVVISTCYYTAIPDQTRLVDSAKRVGAKRFIPCDWGTASPRGIMELHDVKYKIHDYIKEKEVPYTIIDVGFWYQVTLPYKSDSQNPVAPLLRTFYGDGETKSALINKDHIGDFVAHIIADPRTLNQYVFAYEDEVNQKEIYEMCSPAAGEDFKAIHESMSFAAIAEKAATFEGQMRPLYQYQHSIWARGDNQAEAAKSLGALDIKELYPDLKYQSLEEFVKEFY